MATLLSPMTIFLLLLITFSRLALGTAASLPWASVCSYLCEHPSSNTSDVYLNKEQIQHLRECKHFIDALSDSPEMMKVYEDLRNMEMVEFTDAQAQILLAQHSGYFHNREDLPQTQNIIDIVPQSSYELDGLQELEDEFLGKWNAYTRFEDDLQIISGHLEKLNNDSTRDKRAASSPRPPSVSFTEEDVVPDSFQERFYRQYSQAIQSSVEKMKERSRQGRRSGRQKRQAPNPGESLELCPAFKFWNAMVLGFDASGNLVQITQFPEYGQEQWLQEESCLYPLSPAQGNVECRIRFREVPAMVVNLQDPNAPVQESYIRVESCAAYLITNETLVTTGAPPTPPPTPPPPTPPTSPPPMPPGTTPGGV